VFVSELLSCVQRGIIISVIAQKILDPDKTMTVDAEDIGPIISHSTAPFEVPAMQPTADGSVPMVQQLGMIAPQIVLF
jgi:hypothetical protein